MLVCDTCGNPAVETVTFRTSTGNRQRDYCAPHLQELLKDSRAPKRGKKPGQSPSARRQSLAIRSSGRWPLRARNDLSLLARRTAIAHRVNRRGSHRAVTVGHALPSQDRSGLWPEERIVLNEVRPEADAKLVS